MEGIREYLPEQNVMPLENAISQVQDAHSSCANFPDILVGALNKFRVILCFLDVKNRQKSLKIRKISDKPFRTVILRKILNFENSRQNYSYFQYHEIF